MSSAAGEDSLSSDKGKKREEDGADGRSQLQEGVEVAEGKVDLGDLYGAAAGWVEARTSCPHLGTMPPAGADDLARVPPPDSPCSRSMAPSNPSFTLRSILENDKLNGTNYTDWIRNLRIILRAEKKEEVLDTPLPEEPAEEATAAVKNDYKKACDVNLEVSCLMLAYMEPKLQMQFETNHEAYDMIVALQDIFQTQARTERLNIFKAFVECKLPEGAAVGPHVIKMVGYTQRLEKLGFPLSQKLATDFILASLPPSYENFILNYHMHGAKKGQNELCGMLKTAECGIKKTTGSSVHVMAVQNKPSFKKKGKPQKKKGKAKVMISKPKQTSKAGPVVDAECFYCKEPGHWKRNCKQYLASIKDRGSKGTPAPDVITLLKTGYASYAKMCFAVVLSTNICCAIIKKLVTVLL